VFGFYGGKSLIDENSERMQQTDLASIHAPRRIYIVPGDSTDLQFMHQLGTNTLTSLMIMSAAAWMFFGLLRRLQNPGLPIQGIDIIFAINLFIWGISFFIHLMG
jgi:hypothetical protein